MSCFPFKRLIAALLPISFIWIFVACVSICERESTEHMDTQSAVVEVRESSKCTGCPITSFPKARIPERTAHGSDLHRPIALPALMFSGFILSDCVVVASRQRQQSTTDLPLKRLPALRI
jgi:hypothetical protein